jgi:AI-2 transport protein TqsA
VGDLVRWSVTVTFVVLFISTWLIGPLGAVLGIPLTLLVKARLVDIDPGARSADALLRDRPLDVATAGSAAAAGRTDGNGMRPERGSASSGTAAGAPS